MRECCEAHGLDGRDMLYWDDYSEGTFVGGDGSGFALHTDCIQTSNIGTMISGHKLLAIWSHPDETRAVVDAQADRYFTPPLRQAQADALQGCCKVVLAPPGSVYLFSGCNAHVVYNIGLDCELQSCVCASAYEAVTSLHHEHALALAKTNDREYHPPQCWIREEELSDFEEDVAFNIVQLEGRHLDGDSSANLAARQAVATVKEANPGIGKRVRQQSWRKRYAAVFDSETSRNCNAGSVLSVSDLHELHSRHKRRKTSRSKGQYGARASSLDRPAEE